MNASMLSAVRQAIYAAVVNTGRTPGLRALAASAGLPMDVLAQTLEDLAAAHIIVLGDDRRTIRFAPPFAGIDTGFRVTANGRTYSAPCAWDSFGIPAALHADASLEAVCARSGVALACGVRDGRAYGDGIIHLLVPAAHFWDDIVYT